MPLPLSTIPNIIPVLSGKGGVGKSSVTVQLALSLCRAGYSVGVLDIDLTGPSIPRLFGIENEKVKQAPGGWLPVEVHPVFESQDQIPLYSPGDVANSAVTTDGTQSNSTNSTSTNPPHSRKIGSLHCMSLGFLLRNRGDAVVWRGPKKTAMVGQLLAEVLWSEQITHLLIDTPPGTSDEHISMMTNLLDPSKLPPPVSSPSNPRAERRLAAVIVTTPQAISTSDVRKELTFCKKVGLPVLGVVENMAGYVCPCCGEVTNVFSKGGGQIMAQEWGVLFLGSVPLDGEGWGMLVEEGRRPVYRVVGEEEKVGDAVDGPLAPEVKLVHGEPDAGRLVEKYEACSLAPIFETIVGLLDNNEGAIPEYRNTTGSQLV